MPITISCPSCAKQLRVPENLLGRSVRCPSCQNTFPAEEPAEAPPSEPAGDDAGMLSKAPEAPRLPERDEERDDDLPRRSRRSSAGGKYAPHRGGLILGLGIGSVATGGLSVLANLCMCVHPIFGIGPMLLGVIAIGLGIPTLLLGGRDRARMRAGKMDPAGEGQTKGGWICGLIGLILGILEMLCGILMLILVLLGAAMYFSSQP
jgi:predicted Zn finger-like uncharacterized protein